MVAAPWATTRPESGSHWPQKLHVRPGWGSAGQARARATQPEQMYTPGPAISLATCA